MTNKLKHTGRIWEYQPAKRNRTILAVCKILENEYGKPRLDNPTNPIEDLLFVLISNKSNPKIAKTVFNSLVARYPKIAEIGKNDARTIEKIIHPLGLEKIKTSQIIGIATKLKCESGMLAEKTKNEDYYEIEKYLTTFPGVSNKVAKCVILFTLGGKVLPVDSHVHRISIRLGWINRKRADQSHAELEELIMPDLRFSYHVDCILHGRKICRSKTPLCPDCIIKVYCLYFKEGYA
jgi:endonuclease III